MKESDESIIKINYFDERKLLIIREIETNAPKLPNTKSPSATVNKDVSLLKFKH